MGTKPNQIPNPNSCPSSPWPNGLVPDYLLVLLTGIQKGSGWTPGDGDVVLGYYWLPFIVCTQYQLDDPPAYIGVIWTGYHFQVTSYTKGIAVQFLATGPPSDPLVLNNNYQNPASKFYGGTCVVFLWFNGYRPPESWLAGTLFNVPELDGYFAEQGYTGLDDRHYRYANHRDGTNCKILLDN